MEIVARRCLRVNGMHGLGDNLHQRAVIRQLLPDWSVYLDSSWPSVYHDFIAQGLRIIEKPTRLRTQIKNQVREASAFYRGPVPTPARLIHIRYGRQPPLKAMCEATGVSYAAVDITLPVPDAWRDDARALIASWQTTKPLMIYRPLTVRPEWAGAALRNADPIDYNKLFATIRGRYFVASVGDIEFDREWLAGLLPDVDVVLHGGLPFGTLAALFEAAGLVFTSGGFAAILAPAVGTPCVSVYGGYEPAAWIGESSSKFAPWLGIEPINARRDKRIDVPQATARILEFVDAQTP